MRQRFAVVLFALVAGLLANSQSPAPMLSKELLSTERISIYSAFLRAYMKTEERSALNLAANTEPLELQDADRKGCAAGIDPASLKQAATVLHTFTEEAKPLGTVTLVDAQRQTEVIRKNDPGLGIKDGKSVEDAVERAFSTGLFRFSEIAFDTDHKLAIFAYSFYCGGLCGHGGVVVMQKVDHEWRPANRVCQQWIS